MTSGREELGNTGSVETGFRKTECCTQTGTTGTNHDGIVLVVLQEVRTQESLRDQPSILNALTMTGYFSEMYPLASLARSGWLGLANTRARETKLVPAVQGNNIARVIEPTCGSRGGE